MSVSNSSDPTYVFGRSSSETDRLQQQALLFEPSTRRILEAAGLTKGMKVLDVGCGAGDVSLLAARLVGPTGCVVGVDNNPAILETARQRAQAAGLHHLSFVAGDIRDVVLDNDFDAEIGRLVLVYMADQAAALQTIVRHLRPGGIVAFQECDFALSGDLAANETTPQLYRQLISWLVEMFRRTRFDLHMSTSLPETFRQAALPSPQMCLDAIVGCRSDWSGYEYLAGCLRSGLPLITRFEMATEEEIGVEHLHAEIATVLGGNTPTLEHLPRLPYTAMVLQESLRLYPPIWVLSRKAIADDELGGFLIPQGSMVILSPYATQRHPEFWEQPEVFNPERFTPERVAARPHFAHFPFGGGPRLCIGNNFALMEAQLVLATVAQRYRLRLVPGHPVVPEAKITLRPRYGMPMTLQRV